MIDTHCHLNFERYNSDRANVIARAADAGVDRIIIPAIDAASAQEALALTEAYPNIYASVGIHPNSSADFTDNDLSTLAALAAQPKVVAIGEIGLDYYRDRSPKETQQCAFKAQLDLAARLEIPVIIHNREADEHTLQILAKWVQNLPERLKHRPGVMHSFSGSPEIARRVLALGFYLGITGPVTFKDANMLRQVVNETPLDRLVVETDGPFLTPIPHRGKRNEPAYIPHIIERMATIKSTGIDTMARATTENAERLFQLPPSHCASSSI